MKKIKKWFIYWFRLSRMSFKDHIVNNYLKIRMHYIRAFSKNKLNNISEEEKKGYKLTFLDNFDKKSWTVSNRKWRVGEHFGKFHPGKPNVHYGPPKGIEDSCAIFTAKYKPKNFKIDGESTEIPFEVSLLSSHPFKQQFGRFECRMTLPHERGTWPAFWLWGSTWPPEIDVNEAYGGEDGSDIVYQELSLHWGSDDDGTHKNLRSWPVKIDNFKGTETDFHEFVVEWSPDKLEFFTDGIKIFEYTGKEILKKWLNNKTSEMWIILNHSVYPARGDDKGTTKSEFISRDEEKDFYSEFKVDYVRAYEKIK